MTSSTFLIKLKTRV